MTHTAGAAILGWVPATLLAVLSSLAPSSASNLVLPGWDLLLSVPPTTFGGVPFEGVPLGSYDFGSGAQNVGSTDTIVHRLDSAFEPSTAIPTELVALQLQSLVPADFGGGLDTYFITLQSVRGGPASSGRMTINFDPGGEVTPHGTFDSFFNVFFDVRLGALDGPIFLSDVLTLTSTGNPWTHEPPPDSLLIDDINHVLNGSNKENDFFPLGVVQEIHPTGAMHSVVTTPTDHNHVPDAGSTAFALAFALLGLAMCRRSLG
jgi:hypothetical protein